MNPTSSGQNQQPDFDSAQYGDWRLWLLSDIAKAQENAKQYADFEVGISIPRDFFSSLFHDGLLPSELVLLIDDERFDWLDLRVKDTVGTTPTLGMIPYLMSKVRFDGHIDYDPAIGEALRVRYTPDEIALLMSSTFCKPSIITSVGSVIEEGNVAMERVACIVSEDQQCLDAWITLMFRVLKDRSESGYSSTQSLTRLAAISKTTAALGNLENMDSKSALEPYASTRTLMSVTSFLGVFEPDRVKASLERYTDATLYQLSDSQVSGAFDLRGNALHHVFIQAMYLNAENILPFAKIHLKKAPLENNNSPLCGALLAAAPYMDRLPYPIASLIEVKLGGESALDCFMKNHLVNWRDDLIEKIFSNPKLRKLKSKLIDPGTAILHFSRLMDTASLPQSKAVDAKVLYNHLPKSTQRLIYSHGFKRLGPQMTTDEARVRGSLLTVLCILSDSEQIPALRDAVLPTLPFIMRRVTQQSVDEPPRAAGWRPLRASIGILFSKGVLLLSDIGPQLKTIDAVSAMTRVLGVPQAHLLEHVRSSLVTECFEGDLGL